MRAGSLRHQIVIQEPIQSRLANGETVSTWQTVARPRCAIQSLRGNERWAAKALHSERILKFICRGINGVLTTMRIIHNQAAYYILGVTDHMLAGKELSIYGRHDAGAVVLLPELLSGPTATPALNTCLIEWTVDIPSYHKVRYRVLGDTAWIESPWSATATIEADVQLTGL